MSVRSAIVSQVPFLVVTKPKYERTFSLNVGMGRSVVVDMGGVRGVDEEEHEKSLHTSSFDDGADVFEPLPS